MTVCIQSLQHHSLVTRQVYNWLFYGDSPHRCLYPARLCIDLAQQTLGVPPRPPWLEELNYVLLRHNPPTIPASVRK